MGAIHRIPIALAALGCVASSSLADAQQKGPASEAFSQCRAQGKIGDARACWTLWLDKYRKTGSEAEVAYAEEHALPASSQPPPVVPVVPVAPAPPPPTAPPPTSPPPQTAPPLLPPPDSPPPADTTVVSAPPPPPPRDWPPPPVDHGGEPSRVGLMLAPHVSLGTLTFVYGNTHIVKGAASTDATLPSIVVGGGLNVGYDLSNITHVSDTAASLGVTVLAGSGTNTSALLLPIDLWFEKGFRLGKVKLVGAVGPTLQFSWVTLTSTGTAIPEDLHFASDPVYGPALRGGAGLAVRQDFSILLEAVARIPLNTPSYSESDGKTIPPEWQRRVDHFATIGVNLGVEKTF